MAEGGGRQERNDRPWFQVQSGILDSIDLNRLTDFQERTLWRLHALCCRRGNGDTIHASVREIAWSIHTTGPRLHSALRAMAEPGTDGNGIIEFRDGADGYVRIIKWHDYQPATTSSERSRVARDRQRTKARRRGDDAGPSQATTQQRRCNYVEGEEEGEEEGEPPVVPPVAKPSRRVTKRTLPPDWTPKPSHAVIALEQGVNLETETVKFREHALSTGRRMVDWDLCFNTWLRRARDFGAIASSNGGPPRPRVSPAQAKVDANERAAREVIAAMKERGIT